MSTALPRLIGAHRGSDRYNLHPTPSFPLSHTGSRILCAQVCCSVIPWAVYLAFVHQCVMSGIFMGSGWGLAVAALPLACLGLIALVLWCLLCYREALQRRRDTAMMPMPCLAPVSVPAPVVYTPVTLSSPQYFAGPPVMGMGGYSAIATPQAV